MPDRIARLHQQRDGRAVVTHQDIAQAHVDAIREDVARDTVPCQRCGGPILWMPVRGRWGHVRGDRINVSGRCPPVFRTVATPPEGHDGQQILNLGDGT